MAYSCQIMVADARAIHPFGATVLRNVANARIVRDELFALDSTSKAGTAGRTGEAAESCDVLCDARAAGDNEGNRPLC